MNEKANKTPRIVVSLRNYHYFRSISELKDCKHGGYLEGFVQICDTDCKVKCLEIKLIPSQDM